MRRGRACEKECCCLDIFSNVQREDGRLLWPTRRDNWLRSLSMLRDWTHFTQKNCYLPRLLHFRRWRLLAFCWCPYLKCKSTLKSVFATSWWTESPILYLKRVKKKCLSLNSLSIIALRRVEARFVLAQLHNCLPHEYTRHFFFCLQTGIEVDIWIKQGKHTQCG